MAARLSQAGKSTLLLEAGPDASSQLPAGFRDGWTMDREAFDWGYRSEPDGPRDSKPVRRKRVLGGTGWLTRFTPRGHPADFAAWGDGWSWDDVLPHFKRLESDLDFGDEPWHGAEGPLPSARYFDRQYQPVTQRTIEALLALGHPWVDDHNRPGAVGVGRMPMNSLGGLRVTTADGYLPLADASKLTVRCDTLVDRVLFDGGVARGVRLADGSELEAPAVVLCAGTYGSPAILLRSELDLPAIGKNLADHPGVYVDFGYQGPPAQPVLHAIATFRSSGTPEDGAPDLMFWISDPDGDPAEAGVEVVLLKPRSRGEVRLRSLDPADPPVIRLPNLDDGEDVRRLIEGYRLALRVGGLPDEPDDASLEARIRADAYSIPHVVGTCALGSVVDQEGAVHGAERLWVADASIIPEAPSGFVHIPTVMVAEKLSSSIAARLGGGSRAVLETPC